MHFCPTFDCDPVEQSLFSFLDLYKFPDESVHLHISNFAINYGGKEIDSGFFCEHGYTSVEYGFLRETG